MALNLTYYAQGQALDAVTGRASITSKTVYMMLLTAAPTSASTMSSVTEYTATGYTRQVWTSLLPAGTPRSTSNTNTITFGPFTGSPTGTITHYALTDSSSGTGGNLIAWGIWDVAKTPSAGDSPVVAITGSGLTLT